MKTLYIQALAAVALGLGMFYGFLKILEVVML